MWIHNTRTQIQRVILYSNLVLNVRFKDFWYPIINLSQKYILFENSNWYAVNIKSLILRKIFSYSPWKKGLWEKLCFKKECESLRAKRAFIWFLDGMRIYISTSVNSATFRVVVVIVSFCLVYCTVHCTLISPYTRIKY